jgi:hypothetical protein
MENVNQIQDQCFKSFHYRFIINNTSVIQYYIIYTVRKVSLKTKKNKEFWEELITHFP